MIKTWRLDLAHATLVVASQNERMAEIVYFGARLPDELDLEQLVLAGQLDISGGMLDEIVRFQFALRQALQSKATPGSN